MRPKNPRNVLNRVLTCALAMAVAGGWLLTPAAAQSIAKSDRDRAKQMLKIIGDELKKNYYDPTFGGRDFDAYIKSATDRIDTATSVAQALGMVALTLIDLNDSHTFFIPPNLAVHADYGWRVQMIGDQCFVTGVKPGSDAEAKGLKPGDLVLAIDGFKPSRSELWKQEYHYNLLSPRSGTTLVVQPPGGAPRRVDVAAKVTQGKRVLDFTGSDGGLDIDAFRREVDDSSRMEHRFVRIGKVTIWKMPSFGFDPNQADQMVDAAVKDSEALILDLRSNPGGQLKTL